MRNEEQVTSELFEIQIPPEEYAVTLKHLELFSRSLKFTFIKHDANQGVSIFDTADNPVISFSGSKISVYKSRETLSALCTLLHETDPTRHFIQKLFQLKMDHAAFILGQKLKDTLS